MLHNVLVDLPGRSSRASQPKEKTGNIDPRPDTKTSGQPAAYKNTEKKRGCQGQSQLGLTIQKIVSGEDEEQARKDMKASYRFRTVTQLLWVVLAVALPFLNGAAGLIPLFFPSAG